MCSGARRRCHHAYVTEDARTAFAPICCGSLNLPLAAIACELLGSTSATLPSLSACGLGSIIFCFIRQREWFGWAAIFERLDHIEMVIRPSGIMAGAIETSRGDRSGVDSI